MRIAGWILVLCALASAAGLFLPAVEVRVAGMPLGARATLSLYEAHTNRAFTHKLAAGYARTPGRRLAEALAATLLPTLAPRAHQSLDDARDAVTELEEVRLAGVLSLDASITVAIWTYLALIGLLVVVVFGDTMGDRARRGRSIVAVGLAVLVMASAAALYLIWSEAVREVNDEIGIAALVVAYGATLVPLAAAGSLIAAIARIVVGQRSRWGSQTRAVPG